MTETVLVVAPHPDDETLGCGGSMMKWGDEGHFVHWLIVTNMLPEYGFDQDMCAKRQNQIKEVAARLGIASVIDLSLEPAGLSSIDERDVISAVHDVFQSVKPSMVLAPFPDDAHSDHRVVFDAVSAASKSFRMPFVKRLMCYETISETDYGLDPDRAAFKPNTYIDISPHLDTKIETLELYEGEILPHPFPRSAVAVRALAQLRGSQCNVEAAEAFMLLKEIP